MRIEVKVKRKLLWVIFFVVILFTFSVFFTQHVRAQEASFSCTEISDQKTCENLYYSPTLKGLCTDSDLKKSDNDCDRMCTWAVGVCEQVLGGENISVTPVPRQSEVSKYPNLKSDISCEDIFYKCGTGEKNLYKSILDGKMNIMGISSANLLADIRNTFGGDSYKKICIDEKITDIINPLAGSGDVSSPAQKDLDLRLRGSYPSVYGMSRLCPAGQKGSRTPSMGVLEGVYGCCEIGKTFVTNKSLSTQQAMQAYGMCCPSGSTYRDGNTCYNSNDVTTGSGEQYVESRAGLPMGSFDICTILPGTTGDNGYSGFFSTRSGYCYIKKTADTVANEKICDPTYSCSVVVNNTIVIGAKKIKDELTKAGVDTSKVIVSDTTVSIEESYIGPTSIFSTNNGLGCQKCLANNDYIGFYNKDNKSIGLFCKSGALVQQELINNSVSDTQAYLRSDAANQPLLEQCRERGGIYIFVGCVDPTPLGFITGLIRITLGIVGGVALLQLIWVGILLQSGQEKKIATARKNLMATLTGVAVLIFSVVILRILGVNVLDLLPAGSV